MVHSTKSRVTRHNAAAQTGIEAVSEAINVEAVSVEAVRRIDVHGTVDHDVD